MRRLSLWMIGLFGAGIVVAACSATDNGGNPVGGMSTGGSTGSDVRIDVPVDEYGNPINLGTETDCNGLDDNGNDIIDDVDIGKDGVCDCLAVATMGWPKSPGASAADANVGSFTAWLQALGSRPPVLLEDQTITAESLTGIQVLIVQNLSNRPSGYTAAEIAAIANWVSADGGGVMTMAGYTANASDAKSTNAILAAIGGVQYDLSSNTGSGYLQNGDQSVPVLQWNPAHPISSGVTGVGIYYGYPVVVPSNPGVTDWVATVSGLGTTGTAGGTATFGNGHVFVWADEWITFTKEWTTRADYTIPKFMANTMKWLTPQSICQVSIPDSPPMK